MYTERDGAGGNSKRAVNRTVDSLSDASDAIEAGINKDVNVISDYQNSTDFRQASLEFQQKNPELANILNNEEKRGGAEYQAALGRYNNYVQNQMGNTLVGTKLYDSKQLSEDEKNSSKRSSKRWYGNDRHADWGHLYQYLQNRSKQHQRAYRCSRA